MKPERVPCPRECGATFLRQPCKCSVFHECGNKLNGERYKDGSIHEIEVVVGGPDVGTEIRPSKESS